MRRGTAHGSEDDRRPVRGSARPDGHRSDRTSRPWTRWAVTAAGAAALAAGSAFVPAIAAGAGAWADTATGTRTATRDPGVRMDYGRPTVSGGRVTWPWTVSNHGTRPAYGIVVRHETGDSRVGGIPGFCTAAGGAVTCRIKPLAPGESVQGTMSLDMARPSSGQVGVRGRVLWPGGGSTVSKSVTPR